MRKHRITLLILLSWAAATARAEDPGTVHVRGTVEPEEVVDVCARVPGVIASLAPDPRAATQHEYADKTVDYATPVKAGMLLAKIDDAPFGARVTAARAALERARAELALAQDQAALAEAQARQARGREKAVPEGNPAANAAQAKVAQARVAVAEAGVTQAMATLTDAERELADTRIVSPVDGIIIDRQVNVGQSVGLQQAGSTLFLIARGIDRLQVWAAVGEADIGRIHPGQPARFTTAAFPDKTFKGTVRRIRLNAAMERNDVTYTVEIAIEGDVKPLLPYLTADVTLGPAEAGAAPGAAPGAATGPADVNAPPSPREIEAFGLRQIRVLPSGGAATLHVGDADAIAHAGPEVAAAAPIIHERAEAQVDGRRWMPQFVYGTSGAYFSVRGERPLREGEPFTAANVRDHAKVCVIGDSVAAELFPGRSPVGEHVLVAGVQLKVVGLLSPQGRDAVGRDWDDIILIPWTTARERIPSRATGATPANEPAAGLFPAGAGVVDEILVRVADPGRFNAAFEEVVRCLRERHRIAAGEPDDFQIKFPLPPKHATRATTQP